jgi:predicted enzyme related to lactoylglutathione lyase
MTPNAVGWFEIYVQDMKRAKPFYETVLQRTLEKLDSPGMEMWAFPMLADGTGAPGSLVQMEGFPSGGNSTLVYFNCEDCAVEAARVVEAGGRVQREKTSIASYGFIALCFDTEGNMLGLHSQK